MFRHLLLLFSSAFVVIQTNMPGAPSVIDPRKVDPSVYYFALASLESVSKNEYARKIIQISNVTEQIVAGSLYKFTLGLVVTDCPRPKSIDDVRPKCKAAKRTPTEFCVVEVVSQPWEKAPLQIKEQSKCVAHD